MKAERPKTVADFRKSLLEAIDISYGEGTDREAFPKNFEPSTFGRRLFQNRWFWISAALVFLALLYFSVDFRHRDRGATKSPLRITDPSVVDRASIREGSPIVLGREDGVSMHLIPGGLLPLPEGWGLDPGAEEKIAPFYMDETPVTNHQYVDFLNEEIPRITVQAGVVRAGTEIYLLLGEVLEGYEPIIFKWRRFRINKPGHASCPVVRVTAYGAAAYARFYGKRLPTAAEWLYVLINGGKIAAGAAPRTRGATVKGGMNKMMAQMMSPEEWKMADEQPGGSSGGEPLHFPAPVILSPPDRFGVRGLDGNVSEWAAGAAEGYVIMGGFRDDEARKETLPRPLPRHPWEAFEEVGFRCVRSTTPDAAGS